MTERQRAEDAPSHAEVRGAMTRRRMLQGMTAAGLGLAMGSGLPGSVAAQSDERGWASVYVDTTADPPLHEKETCDPELFQGRILGTTHTLQYVGATWVDFGDPEDGAGGAWKHTFVMSGTGAVTQILRDGDRRGIYDPCMGGDVTFTPAPAFDETSMSVEVADDLSANYVAVSERRDASLTGFVNWRSSWPFVEKQLPVGDQEDMTYAEMMREQVLGSKEQLYGDALKQTVDNRNAYREQIDERNDWVVSAISLGVGVGVGAATFGIGGAVAGTVASSAISLANELLNDVEYERPDVDYDEGFKLKYGHGDRHPGAGHYVTFDAYVSPASGNSDEAGTVSFDVTSRHVPDQKSREFTDDVDFDEEAVREHYDFYPEVTWTVEVEQVGHPDDIPDETNIHQARVEDCSRPEANKPSSMGRRPNALFSIDPRPGLTNGPITFDEFSWSLGDTEIVEREWSLSVVENQSGIEGADLPNGGEWTGTKEVEVDGLTPGTYRMSLTVHNEYESDEMIKTFAVTPKPSADVEIAGADDGGFDPGDTATLDASGSSDVDGTIVTRFWRIVGPEEAVEKWGDVVDYEFPVAGEYSISLTVTDDKRANDTATETITVGDVEDGTPGDDGTPTESDAGDGTDAGGGAPTPTDGPTATESPTATGTDVPAATETPTATDAPSATDTATATGSPNSTGTPTATPESGGGGLLGSFWDWLTGLF